MLSIDVLEIGNEPNYATCTQQLSYLDPKHLQYGPNYLVLFLIIHLHQPVLFQS